ncbi:MAG: hypothetical protein AB1798_13840, partial [Spirochaetota bacterium]
MSIALQKVSLKDIDGHSVLLQTGFWGALKSSFGHTPLAFRYFGGAPLLVLVRKIARAFSLAYIPHGPVTEGIEGMESGRQDYLQQLTDALKAFLPPNCIFIRYDLPWQIPSPGEFSLAQPFVKASMDIQPPSSVILDLTQNAE